MSKPLLVVSAFLLSTIIAVLGGNVVRADALVLTNSKLACSKVEVGPNDISQCYIYAFDSAHYATSQYQPSDFKIVVNSQRADVKPIVSALKTTSDPTALTFDVSASAGSVLTVVATTTNADKVQVPIKESGFDIYVLAQPLRLGQVTCDKKVLELRDSMQCKAKAFGADNIPALVGRDSILFTEDRGQGSFTYIRGDKELVFNFTAPKSLAKVSTSFFFVRLSIVGRGEEMTGLRVPIAFPKLKPTARSVLQCVDGIPQLCVLSAHDAIGPVEINHTDFTFQFTRESNNTSDGKMKVTKYQGMKVDWKSLRGNTKKSQSAGRFTFQMAEPDEVFEGKLHVSVAGQEVLGSPFSYHSGVAPAADEAFLRRCGKNILISKSTTECFIEVDEGLVADPSYFTVFSEYDGELSSLVYKRDEETNKPRLIFSYTAPEVHTREEDLVYVSVGGESIQRAPYKMVIYPRRDAEDEKESKEEAADERFKEIALGTMIFGGAILVGAVIALKLRYGDKKSHAAADHDEHSNLPSPAKEVK